MKYKYDGTLDRIKSILPCQKGDIYYTIEKVSQINREIKEDHGGNPVVMEHSTIIGKEIKSHYWQGIHEIIREMEHKNIGKRIFLTKKKLKISWKHIGKIGGEINPKKNNKIL